MQPEKNKKKLVTEGRLDVFRVEILKEIRAMIHEALLGAIENAKIYHQKETERYIGALFEQQAEILKAYLDEMRSMRETGIMKV